MAPLTDRVFVITGGGGALAGPIARGLAVVFCNGERGYMREY